MRAIRKILSWLRVSGLLLYEEEVVAVNNAVRNEKLRGVVAFYEKVTLSKQAGRVAFSSFYSRVGQV